jgi:hypothetical protein
MKQMIIGAVGAVVVAFAIGTGIASDNKAAATNKGDTLLLMSGGNVVAELRVIAPVKLSVSDCKITTRSGKAVWQSRATDKPVTVRLDTAAGKPVEIKAEEMQADYEAKVDKK